MFILKKGIPLIGVFFIAIGCAFSANAPKQPPTAPKVMDESALIYISYSKEGRGSQILLTPEDWLEKNPEEKKDFILKMASANVYEEKYSGLRHAAFFRGEGHLVQKAFFDPTNAKHLVAGIQSGIVPTIRISNDDMMMGISFDLKAERKHVFFRIANNAGRINGEKDKNEGLISPPKPETQLATADLKKGFTINDSIDADSAKKLPRFALRTDYNRAFGLDDIPWRGKNLDVRDPKDAVRLAFLLEAYFLDGMANQNSDPDLNFNAFSDSKHYWSNIPWQNQGTTGREGIHGFTKERDLVPSITMKQYQGATSGSNWGIGYYNAIASQTLLDLFGTESNPKSPDFSQVIPGSYFQDGTLITKFLSTTADFPQVHHAFTWHANVSESGWNYRTIHPVRFFQLNFALKDSKLKGTLKELNHWAMITFYYDETFDYKKEFEADLGPNPLAKIKGLPKSFLKLRPMGLQYGLDKNQTITFKNADSNGYEGRLNGPAENAKSSCLSCHATAGTTYPFVPGFMATSAFAKMNGQMFDFNYQLAFAKRTLETMDSNPAPTP